MLNCQPQPQDGLYHTSVICYLSFSLSSGQWGELPTDFVLSKPKSYSQKYLHVMGWGWGECEDETKVEKKETIQLGPKQKQPN